MEFSKKNRPTCRIFCCRRLLDSSCLVLKELRRNNKSFYLFRRKHLCDFKQTPNFGTQCLYWSCIYIHILFLKKLVSIRIRCVFIILYKMYVIRWKGLILVKVFEVKECRLPKLMEFFVQDLLELQLRVYFTYFKNSLNILLLYYLSMMLSKIKSHILEHNVLYLYN